MAINSIRNGNFTQFNAIQLSGETETINSVVVTPVLADTNGNILLCTGTAAITDTSTGFAKGCLFIRTDIAGGTGGLYCNKGTTTSSQFTLVTQG